MKCTEENLFKYYLLISLIFFFLPVLSNATLVFSATYYIHPDGNDDNPGTLSQPWKTISKANSILKAGDTVYIRGGAYDESIRPLNSGSAGNYIVYTNYNGEQVTIDRNSSSQDCIELNEDYIVVDGFYLTHCRRYVAGRYNHCIIKNCTMTGATATGALLLDTCNYNKILNNYIEGQTLESLNSGVERDAITIGRASSSLPASKYNLIEGNDILYGGHSNIYLGRDAHYNIIRNNLLHDNGDLSIDFDWPEDGDSYTLIENNIFYRPGQGPDGSGAHMQCHSNKDIVRNNIFYDGGSNNNPSCYVVYYSGDYPTQHVEHTKFYHNTFYKPNNGGMLKFACNHADYYIRHFKLKNNIMLAAPSYQILEASERSDSYENPPFLGFEYANNLIRKYSAGQDVIRIQNTWYTLSEAEATMPDKFYGNIDTDPLFVDEATYDFHLQSGSPCINAGTFLTKTVGSGSGGQIIVRDAGYFYDGFGIIEGDLIQLEGQTQTARITRVDYDNNTISIDRTLTWYNGQGVSLPFNGSAPDIGAYEYGGVSPLNTNISASPTSGQVPLTVNFTGFSTGGTPPYSYNWNFGDNQSSDEQNPTHIYATAKTYTATLTVSDNKGKHANKSVIINAFDYPTSTYLIHNTFEQNSEDWGGAIGNTAFERDNSTAYIGNYSMHVYATGAASKLSIDINLEAWKVDQYPFLSFAYKIPNNVPVGMFFNTDAGWILLGGSKNFNSGGYSKNDEYTLLDDNSWHLITLKVKDKIREIKPSANTILEFEWYTHNNGQQGDEFWFDEVMILADNNASPTASISLSDLSPTKAGLVEVILTTSKNVTSIPTPLIFTASDNSVTSIDLQGSIPGTTFTGAFDVNGSIAEGVGYFSLPTDALADEQGNTGNEIVSGIYVKIDKTPPGKPKNLIARNITP